MIEEQTQAQNDFCVVCIWCGLSIRGESKENSYREAAAGNSCRNDGWAVSELVHRTRGTNRGRTWWRARGGH
jgi:hypothetical protein